MRTVVLLLLSLSVLLGACEERSARTVIPQEGPPPIAVSLSAVIATPERYDGQLIETQGVIATGYYDWQLYLSREDYDQFFYLNGVALNVYGPPAREPDPAFERLEGRNVEVVGVFSDGVAGHMGMERGLLVVRSVRELPGRRQLNYVYGASPGIWPLPWLIVVGVFIGLVGVMALGVRGPAGPEAKTRRLPLIALAIGLSIFTAAEVRGAYSLVFEMGPAPFWHGLSIATGVLGILGWFLMWVFIWRRRPRLTVAMMALQLLTPAVRELGRIETWPSQVVFPFDVDVRDRSWVRPEWPPAPMPTALPRTELGEPELPPAGATAVPEPDRSDGP